MIRFFDNRSQFCQHISDCIYGSTFTDSGPDLQPKLIITIHKMLHIPSIQTYQILSMHERNKVFYKYIS